MAMRAEYEDFEPKFDEKEEPTAYMLHVYLPGFVRQQLKVTYDDSAKKIRARGERPLGNHRWSRFEKEFSIPDNCIASEIRGKFEKNVLIITMPKKVITQVPPQEPEAKKATEEAASAAAEPKKVREDIPPKTLSSTSDIPKPKEDKTTRFPTPIPSRAATEPGSQKGQQVSSQKLASTADHGEKEREKKAMEPVSPPKPTSKRTRKHDDQKETDDKSSKKSKEPAIAQSTSQAPLKDKTGGYGYASAGYHQDELKNSGAKRSKEARDLVTSAKAVMGKLAKRVKEDENSRQSLINAGVAAVVIVAVGAYIAHTISSKEAEN